MNKNCEVTSGEIYYLHSTGAVSDTDADMSHCHSDYEILFAPAGSGEIMVEGSAFMFSEKTLILTRPFAYHSLRLDSHERYVIRFSPRQLVEEAKQMLDLLLDKDESGKYFDLSRSASDIISLLDRFEAAQHLPDTERQIYLKMLISELIILLAVSDGERLWRDEGELGARVIKYLNDNITKNINLDKLARKFFVSKYYLCRAFKKHNGISVHGYVTKKRVMRAKQLIESGETASSAAYKVGFGDYSAFYRAYVKVVGKSPTAD